MLEQVDLSFLLARSPWPMLWCALTLFFLRLARRSAWLTVPALAVGTLLHELTHWLLASLTFGRPSRFSLWPQRLPDGSLLLGRVELGRVRWWNGALIAFAPLLLLALAGWLLLQGNDSPLDLRNVLLGLVAGQCLMSCWPSRQDFVLGAPSLLVYLLFAFLFWHHDR